MYNVGQTLILAYIFFAWINVQVCVKSIFSNNYNKKVTQNILDLMNKGLLLFLRIAESMPFHA